MKLIISEEIQNKFPGLRIAVVIARGIDNSGTDPSLQELKKAAASRMYDEFTYGRLDELPEITAWREAYRAFGVKPKDSRPTAEAFLRRLIKGDDFPDISKAVDSYLLTETEYFLPVGGYDLNNITGNISLRFSEGGETFRAIGAKLDEFTRAGEVVYADDVGVLTRKWNYRDCDRCKITEQSKDIALFSEAPSGDVPTSVLSDSIEVIARRVVQYCGGKAETMFLQVSEGCKLALY